MRLGLVGYITEIKGSDRLTKNLTTYTRSNPLDNDLSGGLCYPAFEQLGPGFHRCSIILSFFVFFFSLFNTPKIHRCIFQLSWLLNCSLQNLRKTLASVNYRPAAHFSVFRFLRSFFCTNESMAAAEGQSTNQTGQATPAVHDEVDTGHNNQKKTIIPADDS